tara:strand:+ start:185 stop:826 length:642 start_codon:yes stop_codon:yes gene_type:complete
MRNISPSILSANFQDIFNHIRLFEKLGITRLHLDVMDGNFVPNLTFGPIVIKSIREHTNLHLESHLMITNPHNYIKDYAVAGSDTIIIHQEASKDIIDDLKKIQDYGKLSGIALNPDTSEEKLDSIIQYLDYILIMSVYPGFGGQKFINDTLIKMNKIVKLVKNQNILVSVDGGVGLDTISNIYKTGIDITVVGSALLNSNNIKENYKNLLNV